MPPSIRKEIKQPDAFQTAGFQGMAWLQAHGNRILLAGAAVLIASGGAWGYGYWAAKTQEKASIAYMLAEDAKGPEAIEALRRTALQYPKTRSGVMARLELAEKLREGGQLPGAEQEYRILLGSDASVPMDKELAQRGLAAVLEAQGKCPEAIAVWREIIARGSLISQEDLYLAVAACQEKAGQPQEAAKTLEEFSQKSPRSPFLNEIHRERLDRLAKPVAPAAKTPPASPPKSTK